MYDTPSFVASDSKPNAISKNNTFPASPVRLLKTAQDDCHQKHLFSGGEGGCSLPLLVENDVTETLVLGLAEGLEEAPVSSDTDDLDDKPVERDVDGFDAGPVLRLIEGFDDDPVLRDGEGWKGQRCSKIMLTSSKLRCLSLQL